MSKRIVRSLQKTGRISRRSARAAARNVRSAILVEEQKSGVKPAPIKKKRMTASGKGDISFHIGGPLKSPGKLTAREKPRANALR